MPHFCLDELLLIMSAIPFVGVMFRVYRDKIHGWFHHKKGETPKGITTECPHDHDHEKP